LDLSFTFRPYQPSYFLSQRRKNMQLEFRGGGISATTGWTPFSMTAAMKLTRREKRSEYY